MKFSLIIDVSLIVYLLVYVFVFSGRRNTRKAKVVSSSGKHLYVQVIDGTKKHALALFGLPFASIIEFFFTVSFAQFSFFFFPIIAEMFWNLLLCVIENLREETQCCWQKLLQLQYI